MTSPGGTRAVTALVRGSRRSLIESLELAWGTSAAGTAVTLLTAILGSITVSPNG
jgi:hypothetical protein